VSGFQREAPVARSKYGIEKRQRELSKERKREEKRQRKLDRKNADNGGDDARPAPDVVPGAEPDN
jgi:hypothetical protein